MPPGASYFSFLDLRFGFYMSKSFPGTPLEVRKPAFHCILAWLFDYVAEALRLLRLLKSTRGGLGDKGKDKRGAIRTASELAAGEARKAAGAGARC